MTDDLVVPRDPELERAERMEIIAEVLMEWRVGTRGHCLTVASNVDAALTTKGI